MEARMIYWELCAMTLVNAGYVVRDSQSNGRRSYFAKSISCEGNDRMDAELLARYAAEKTAAALDPHLRTRRAASVVQRRER